MDNGVSTEDHTKKDGKKPSKTTDPAEFTQDYNKTIYQYTNGELTGTYKVGEIIKTTYGKSDMIALYDPAKIRKYKLDVFPLIMYDNKTRSGYSFDKINPDPEKTGGKRRQTKKSRRTRKTKRRLRNQIVYTKSFFGPIFLGHQK
jgi:hypothetical protein